MNEKARQAFLNHVRPEHLSPQLTRLSRKSGVPVSTLYDAWKNGIKDGTIKITFHIARTVETTVWDSVGEDPRLEEEEDNE